MDCSYQAECVSAVNFVPQADSTGGVDESVAGCFRQALGSGSRSSPKAKADVIAATTSKIACFGRCVKTCIRSIPFLSSIHARGSVPHRAGPRKRGIVQPLHGEAE